MNHFSFGTFYRFTLFGGSHEPCIGVEIEGIPAGLPLDRAALQAFLDRRAPGRGEYASSRREADEPRFEEGLAGDVFTGMPLRIVIENRDQRPEDYAALRVVPRPGHADWPAFVRYGEIPAGGGHFSGRMTAAYCLAGGIAKQLLEREGVTVSARVLAIGGIPAEEKAAVEVALREAKAQGDSLGGLIQCEVTGMPIALGDHPFGGLENRISQAVFAIPGVKGIEFGDGFALAAMKGSEANDGYRLKEGRVMLQSNHAGGILGGMSSGAPLVFRAAFKPTPSIALPQESVDLAKRENVALTIFGRHDVCIALRAVPVVEAAAAVTLYDALLERKAMEAQDDLTALRLRIDAADRQIAEVFRQRMEAVDQIRAAKKVRGSAVADAKREAEVLEKVLRRGDHWSPADEEPSGPPDCRKELKALYESIFQISKERQGQ